MDVVETHSRRFGFRCLKETGNGWRRDGKLNNIDSEEFLVLHLKNSLSAIEREGPPTVPSVRDRSWHFLSNKSSEAVRQAVAS